MRLCPLFLALAAAAVAMAQQSVPTPSLADDEENPRLMAGLERRTVTVDGRERVFYVHKPAGLKTPAPALFALHGGNGTAPRRAQQTGFNAIAARERFLAVYPQGVNYGWNDGRNTDFLKARHENADDVAFFRAMFAALTAAGEADAKRLYVVGGSNGGMMTHRLACEITGQLAAVTILVASLPEPLAPVCRPSRPLPMLMMNGTADPLVRFDGGVVALREDNGRTIPVMDTVAFWRKANGCPAQAKESQAPDRDPEDGMRTDVFTWAPCKGGSEVVFYKMNGAGHGLPGRSRVKSEVAERLGGKSSNDFDSSEEAWAFVKRFSLP